MKKFLIVLSSAIFFFGCSANEPFSGLNEIEENADRALNELKSSSSNTYYNDDCDYYGSCSSSSYSRYYYSSSYNSWENCYYYCMGCSSSSSKYYYSSSSVTAYLTEKKILNFQFTSYEQLIESCETLGKFSDCDPIVKFDIIYKDRNETVLRTKATGTLLSGEDLAKWTGKKTVRDTVPIGTAMIYVKPYVYDADPLVNESLSSGYSYGRTNIGYLENEEVIKQSDYENEDVALEWYWYLTDY